MLYTKTIFRHVPFFFKYKILNKPDYIVIETCLLSQIFHSCKYFIEEPKFREIDQF